MPLLREISKKFGKWGHLLKGICAPYGFPEMGLLGEELQTLSKEKDIHGLKKKTEDMEQMIQAFPSPPFHRASIPKVNKKAPPKKKELKRGKIQQRKKPKNAFKPTPPPS